MLNGNLRDLVKISRPRLEAWSSRPTLETSKFVHFAESFQKNVIITSDLNFFKFLAFFRHVVVVSYQQIQQKKLFESGILINHFFAIFTVSRPRRDLKPPRLAKMGLETPSLVLTSLSMVSLRKKLTSRVALLTRLAGVLEQQFCE